MASFYYYCPCKVVEIGLGHQQGDAAYLHWPIEKIKCKYCGESLKQLDTRLAIAIASIRGGRKVIKRLVEMGRD